MFFKNIVIIYIKSGVIYDTRLCLYSNKSDIDCSYAAKIFGGGGHKGAAGCYFEQLTPPTFLLEDGETIKVVKEKD